MITLILVSEPGQVSVQVVTYGEDGQRAVLRQDVRPGESFGLWSYDELQKMGTGAHEVEDRPFTASESGPIPPGGD